MVKQTNVNLDITANSDGFDIKGGTTGRKLTVTGADITMTGSGSAVLTFPSTTDTLVGRATTDTLTNKTLTAPVLANGGYIADANGNEVLIATTTASAVNEFTLTPGATTVGPVLAASGGDSNIAGKFGGKGSGGAYLINGCQLYTTALSQTSSGSSQVVSFNSSAYEVYDPLNMHDPVTNSSRITAAVAGAYRVTAMIYWADNTTGVRISEVRKNGTTTMARAAGAMDAAGRCGHSIIVPLTLAAADYIELNNFQSSGGTLAYTAISFSLERIGD